MTSNKDESPRYELVSFDSFDGVDAETISYQAERLRVLGFEHAADYCLSSSENQGVQFLTRLVRHPAYNCYAEVYQSVKDARPLNEVRHAFISLIERDWRVSSMGHEPLPLVSLICSRPRRAWSSHANADVFVVFDAHLKLRQRVTTKRGLCVRPLPTLEGFFDEQRREYSAQREWLEKLNERGIEKQLYGHPKSFWAGDEAPASRAA
jgi:hypothetical protein